MAPCDVSITMEYLTENVVEITTLSTEQCVLQWASENKIGEEAVARLFAEGFTSLEAIRLLDADDLSKSKITRGQKKLILQCVRVLNGGKTITSETTAPREPINDAPIQTSSNDMRAPSASQSATSTSQNGGASSSACAHTVDQSETSTIQNGSAHASMDTYVQGLFSQLTRGQSQARNGIASESFTGNSVLSDNGQSLLGATPASNVNSAPQTQSWKDPQIYLSSAANGKSASLHYDIVDFVSGNVEEEIVVGGSGSHQVVLKSGPKKTQA